MHKVPGPLLQSVPASLREAGMGRFIVIAARLPASLRSTGTTACTGHREARLSARCSKGFGKLPYPQFQHFRLLSRFPALQTGHCFIRFPILSALGCRSRRPIGHTFGPGRFPALPSEFQISVFVCSVFGHSQFVEILVMAHKCDSAGVVQQRIRRYDGVFWRVHGLSSLRAGLLCASSVNAVFPAPLRGAGNGPSCPSVLRGLPRSASLHGEQPAWTGPCFKDFKSRLMSLNSSTMPNSMTNKKQSAMKFTTLDLLSPRAAGKKRATIRA